MVQQDTAPSFPYLKMHARARDEKHPMPIQAAEGPCSAHTDQDAVLAGCRLQSGTASIWQLEHSDMFCLMTFSTKTFCRADKPQGGNGGIARVSSSICHWKVADAMGGKVSTALI